MIKKLINDNRNFLLKISLLIILFSLIHYAMGYPPRINYTAGIVALLIVINQLRIIYSGFIIIFTIIAALYFPIRLLYGTPSLTIATSVSYTNLNEAIEFISNIPYYLYAGSLFILLFGFFCTTFKLKIGNKTKIGAFITFLAFLLYGPIKDYKETGEFDILNSGYPEIKFVKDFNNAKEETNKLFSLLAQTDNFQPKNSATPFDTYVMVIGESARRDFMHVYGFPINNTPFMDSANGILFNHYISAASSTIPSLTSSLTQAPKLANSVIALAKKWGFTTYWLSNQGAVGIYDTPIASMGKKADHSFFLKRASYNSKETNDDELLPQIATAIKAPQAKKFIIVHLIGSHPRTCARTNDHYETFYKSEEISCYIQSIKNTDQLLATIHQYLTDSQSKWTMIYFSDHGLGFVNKNNPSDLKLTHNDQYRQDYEVPLFISSYNSNERQYITAARSGINFLTLFSEWSGIDDPSIDHSCHIISNDICHQQNSVIDFNNKRIDYTKLPSDMAP
uniref:Phosphoethanolamine transferase OpgE n=1 Tax=Arsenophonus endosymbiont of Trialeurodes vaporariorum TaxID=235567 RepID=A0A3B0M158_9GAMM